MNGAIYFLQAVFSGKSVSSGPKEEKQEKSKIIPIKKKKSLKNSAPVTIVTVTEKKKSLDDLNANFRKAYNASSKLKNLAKASGTDMERFQLQVIHSQMRVIAKALENLKK